MVSSCFSARSQSPENAESSKRNMRAETSVGLRFTVSMAAVIAPDRSPSSNLSFASVIEDLAAVSIFIRCPLLDQCLGCLHIPEDTFIEQVASAWLDRCRN